MMMYTFATIAAQLFLALSVGAPTAAADFIGSVVNAPTSPKVNRRIQQAPPTTEFPTESPMIIQSEPPTVSEAPTISFSPSNFSEAPTVGFSPTAESPVPTGSPVIIQSEPPTVSEAPTVSFSPTVASMSYTASFSLVYHSKAAKGKAHKTGKSKDGKLIRQRRV